MSVFSEIQKDVKGSKILVEWLGQSGSPVSSSHAAERAAICPNCPFNVQPRWWEKAVHAVADWIKGALEIKNKLDLHVPNEESLGMCKRCGCCNQLAIWVPIIHIAHHTTRKELAELPDECWKKKEIKEVFNAKF